MKLLSEVRGEDGRLDLSALVARIPYAQFLGVHVEERGNEIHCQYFGVIRSTTFLSEPGAAST